MFLFGVEVFAIEVAVNIVFSDFVQPEWVRMLVLFELIQTLYVYIIYSDTKYLRYISFYDEIDSLMELSSELKFFCGVCQNRL